MVRWGKGGPAPSWVLERSIDVNGADFLVPCRPTIHRLTDKVPPPRLGVVQAKFFQDEGTTHCVPWSYVVDDKGEPLEGFFYRSCYYQVFETHSG